MDERVLLIGNSKDDLLEADREDVEVWKNEQSIRKKGIARLKKESNKGEQDGKRGALGRSPWLHLSFDAFLGSLSICLRSVSSGRFKARLQPLDCRLRIMAVEGRNYSARRCSRIMSRLRIGCSKNRR